MLPDGNTQLIVALGGLLLFAAWESLSPFFSFFKNKERSRHLFKNLVCSFFTKNLKSKNISLKKQMINKSIQ